MNTAKKKKKKPPDDLQKNHTNGHKWRQWHEREVPVQIKSTVQNNGVRIIITSKQLNQDLSLNYPETIWKRFPKNNKHVLLDNIACIFTAHLPLLLKGNIRLEYNTGYPHSFLWANQSFVRHLPAYWYLYNRQRGKSVSPLLKTILNSRSVFAATKDLHITFPETLDENVLIPFTFGKDSFLSYHIAKDLGLKPTLIWFNDPLDEGYEGKHKKKLFDLFFRKSTDRIYVIDNPLGSLREKGEGSFGWELAITSWIVLSIPFAFAHKSGYILLGNEKSTNAFFYDDDGYRVVPDYEQCGQATEEISLLTQALTEGEVFTTTFLQGVHDLGIIGILKDRYFDNTFPYLMSCWSESEEGKDKRWCGDCSKCARLFIYLVANGVDPIKDAGFTSNMLTKSNMHLFNVFGKKATGTGWDAFGLNLDEQSLAFYIAYLRGNRSHLVNLFHDSALFRSTKSRFHSLLEEYYGVHDETITPVQWRKKIHRMFKESLKRVTKEIIQLSSRNN